MSSNTRSSHTTKHYSTLNSGTSKDKKLYFALLSFACNSFSYRKSFLPDDPCLDQRHKSDTTWDSILPSLLYLLLKSDSFTSVRQVSRYRSVENIFLNSAYFHPYACISTQNIDVNIIIFFNTSSTGAPLWLLSLYMLSASSLYRHLAHLDRHKR